MAYSNQSKYSKEEIDRMAGECYELLKRGETTFVEYAERMEVCSRNLREWVFTRYGVRAKDFASNKTERTYGFVKVGSCPSGRRPDVEPGVHTVTIEYYGARMTASAADLAGVLHAIREASNDD